MSGYSAPAFWVQPTGFIPKITSDFLLDITTKARGTVDANLDLGPTEPMGQIVGAVAGSLAEVGEVLQTIYNAVNPNAAAGVFLYGIGAISGTKPKPATFSSCIVNANMATGATVAAGLVANVNGQTTNTWILQGACDSVGNLLSTVLTASGAGVYTSLWFASAAGPIAAAAGQLTVVPSLPAGLNSITNPQDAVKGQLAETDSAFRTRRELEIAASGSESLDAIRAAVLLVTGVISCQVFENYTDTVDAFGRPPHSIEAVVWDAVVPAASSNAIAQALWNNKPGGIQYYTFSGDNGNAKDSQGNLHNVIFTRVAPITVYVNITTVGVPTGATGSTTAVANSIVSTSSKFVPGSGVIRSQLMCAPLPDGPFPVAGCTDVTAFTLGLSGSPTGVSNLTMTVRQFPYLSTGNIVVTLT